MCIRDRVWTANVTLIGTDSWADGRYGNYHRSEVVMNDSKIIYDLYNATKNALLTMTFAGGALLTKMQELADKDAHQLLSLIHISMNISKEAS